MSRSIQMNVNLFNNLNHLEIHCTLKFHAKYRLLNIQLFAYSKKTTKKKTHWNCIFTHSVQIVIFVYCFAFFHWIFLTCFHSETSTHMILLRFASIYYDSKKFISHIYRKTCSIQNIHLLCTLHNNFDNLFSFVCSINKTPKFTYNLIQKLFDFYFALLKICFLLFY